MKSVQISLANVQGKLNRAEMKKVTGGFDSISTCATSGSCSYYESGTGIVTGSCVINTANNCVCKAENSSVISAQCDTASGDDTDNP